MQTENANASPATPGGIVATIRNVGPADPVKWTPKHERFSVALKAPNGATTRFFYHMNPVATGRNGPTPAEVLLCHADDALGFDNARDFSDFMSEYGHSTAAEALPAWSSCKSASSFFKRAGLDAAEIANALSEWA